MRFGSLLVPVFFFGCKDKSSSSNYSTGDIQAPEKEGTESIPTWSTDPSISNAFSRMIAEQNEAYTKTSYREMEAVCPPPDFTIFGKTVTLQGKLAAPSSSGVNIQRLSDSTRLMKTSTHDMYYMRMAWTEKAVLSSIEKLGISPRVVPKSSLSLSTGCELRSFVMDFVGGEALDAYFANRGNHVDFKIIAEIVRLTLKALEKLHNSGIVHADIHPGNVVYNEGMSAVKLIDYGRAKSFVDSTGSHVASTRVPLDPNLNPVILSPAELRGYSTSRSDDVFRLAEMMIYLIEGPVGIADKQWVRENGFRVQAFVFPPLHTLIYRKENRVFTPSIPKALQEFYREAVKLKFGATPNYDALAAILG